MCTMSNGAATPSVPVNVTSVTLVLCESVSAMFQARMAGPASFLPIGSPVTMITFVLMGGSTTSNTETIFS